MVIEIERQLDNAIAPHESLGLVNSQFVLVTQAVTLVEANHGAKIVEILSWVPVVLIVHHYDFVVPILNNFNRIFHLAFPPFLNQNRIASRSPGSGRNLSTPGHR
jgi:hypothetical protein